MKLKILYSNNYKSKLGIIHFYYQWRKYWKGDFVSTTSKRKSNYLLNIQVEHWNKFFLINFIFIIYSIKAIKLNKKENLTTLLF